MFGAVLYGAAILSAGGVALYFFYLTRDTDMLHAGFALTGVGFVCASVLLILKFAQLQGLLMIHPQLLFWAFPMLIVFEVVLFAFIGRSINANVAAPLNDLTSVMNDVNKQELETEVPEQLLARDDEIGRLSQAFKRLLTSLKLAVSRAN